MAMPGTPVKLLWSREEDMRQGRYRPVSRVTLRGALDRDGNWTAWESHNDTLPRARRQD